MAKPTRKRRVKKNIESGIAHIHATFNNTIVTVSYTHLDVYKRQTMKRFRPRAKGSASPINKRTAHITVAVAEK